LLQNRAFAQAVRVEFGGTINEAADDELMQVGISPAEGGLDDFVQLSKVKVEREQEPPPDGRLDLLDGNFGLDAVLVGHGAMMTAAMAGGNLRRSSAPLRSSGGPCPLNM
jgi:hypothetical protein